MVAGRHTGKSRHCCDLKVLRDEGAAAPQVYSETFTGPGLDNYRYNLELYLRYMILQRFSKTLNQSIGKYVRHPTTSIHGLIVSVRWYLGNFQGWLEGVGVEEPTTVLRPSRTVRLHGGVAGIALGLQLCEDSRVTIPGRPNTDPNILQDSPTTLY